MWRCLVLLLALSACAQFPALDATVTSASERADYPELVPLDPLLAGIAQPPNQNARTQASLEARVASLRARAARLRGRVVDGATRARMQSGVTRF